MTIETSTANVLLSAIVMLQAWIIRELFKINAKICLIVTFCPKCRNNPQFDTDRITKDQA